MKKKIKTSHDITLTQLLQIRSYRSLVVSRNPYSRTLSAFLDKVSSGNNPIFSSCPGYGVKSPQGFASFLKYLEDDGTKFDRHFWPQTDPLYQPLNQFTCVAKLETFPSDLVIFLSKIGVQSISYDKLRQPHAIEKNESGKITNTQNKISDYFDEYSCRAIERIYEADFEAFKYSPRVL